MSDTTNLKEVLYEDQYKQKIHIIYILLSGNSIVFLISFFYFGDNLIHFVAISIAIVYPVYRLFVSLTRVEFYDFIVIVYLAKIFNLIKNAKKHI